MWYSDFTGNVDKTNLQRDWFISFMTSSEVSLLSKLTLSLSSSEDFDGDQVPQYPKCIIHFYKSNYHNVS